VRKILPDLKALDPLALKDFSQFEDMEHVCFPQIAPISEEYDGKSILQMNDRL
jgi:hypothetical protein